VKEDDFASRKNKVAQDGWSGDIADLFDMDLPEPRAMGAIADIPITQGEKVMVYGPSGSKKTLFTYHWALSHIKDGGRGLLLQGEGNLPAFKKRLMKLWRGMSSDSLPTGKLYGKWKAFDIVQYAEVYRFFVDEAKPDFVVLDTMNLFSPANENDVMEVTKFLEVSAYAVDKGATLVLVTHSSKSGERGKLVERGSSAIRGWADSSICIEPIDKIDSGPVMVSHVKCRDGARSKARTLNWEFEADRYYYTEQAEHGQSEYTKVTSIMAGKP